METSEATVDERRDSRDRGEFILSGLSFGHAVMHWLNQSFFVMLPEIQAAFGLTEVGVGGITTVRELVSGIVTLPGGVAVDLLRRHWGLVLAVCMGGFGVGWLLIGNSSLYGLLLIGTGITAVAGSIWHLPAMAALSQHFSDRKGTALSIHGIGGNIGDILGPIVTGVLLGYLTWSNVLSIYAAVPIFLTVLVFWAFKNLGRSANAAENATEPEKPDIHLQIAKTRELFRKPALWLITFASGLRGMANVAFITFLPLYLDNELGMSPLTRGLLIGLLVVVGVFATPVMGYISDRVNRKVVLVPGLVWLAVLTALMVPFGQGFMLIVILALLGLFMFSDQPILSAAALDIAGEGVATTTLGVISFSRFILSAASPIIAGALYQTRGIDATFLYIASILALAALTILFIPLPGHRKA